MKNLFTPLEAVFGVKKSLFFSCIVFLIASFFILLSFTTFSNASFHNTNPVGAVCESITEYNEGYICPAGEIGTCCPFGPTDDRQTKWMSCEAGRYLGIKQQSCVASASYELPFPKSCSGQCGPLNFTQLLDCQEVANAFLASCDEAFPDCNCGLEEWDCQAFGGCFSLVPAGPAGVCSSTITWQCGGDGQADGGVDVECIDEGGEEKCDPYFTCQNNQCVLVEGDGFGVSGCDECSGGDPGPPEECETNSCFSQECPGWDPDDCGFGQDSTCEITADPSPLAGAGDTTLSWTTTPLAPSGSCIAGGGWEGTKDGSGAETVSLSETTNFTLECSNGAYYCEREVTVYPPPPPPPPDDSCPLKGWAWGASDGDGGGGIGWVNFDNGMWIDLDGDVGDAGALYGYAWANPGDGMANESGSYGWIQFGNLSGFPQSPSQNARVNLDTGEVTGWAKILSGEGQYDSWIKLSGTHHLSGNGGVTYDPETGQFSGYAWGGETIGWISFDPIGEFGVSADFGNDNCDIGTDEEFTFSLLAPDLPLNEGDTKNNTITVSTVTGGEISEEVTLSEDGITSPVGVVPVQFNGFVGGNSCNPGVSDCPVVMSFSAPEGSEGTHTVNIEGQSISHVESDSFTVIVGSSGGGPEASCQPSHTTRMVGLPVTWTLENPPAEAQSYEWIGTNDLSGCSGPECVKVYTQLGIKEASVEIYGGGEGEEEGLELIGEVVCEPPVNIVVLPVFQQF